MHLAVGGLKLSRGAAVLADHEAGECLVPRGVLVPLQRRQPGVQLQPNTGTNCNIQLGSFPLKINAEPKNDLYLSWI